MTTTTTTRLDTEIRLLYTCEGMFKLPAALVIRQLVEWEDARLPDRLPPVPEWVEFNWPASGGVNLDDYRRAKDRAQGRGWMEPYL